MSLFEVITIVNSIILVVCTIVFTRRLNKLSVLDGELLELNNKAHDFTVRADQSLKNYENMDSRDYNRLGYLISRFKKHDPKLSALILDYKLTWDKANKTNSILRMGVSEYSDYKKELLKMSQEIRDKADELLTT